MGTFEHAVEVDFSYLESVRGQHIFTKEICHEMTRRQQWGKGFGIMKKTLDLAITTGRSEELYNLHLKLAKDMETELAAKSGQAAEQENNLVKFAQTINNPVHVKTKGRKSKRVKGFNDEMSKKRKSKKRKTYGHCEISNNDAESSIVENNIHDIDEQELETRGMYLTLVFLFCTLYI